MLFFRLQEGDVEKDLLNLEEVPSVPSPEQTVAKPMSDQQQADSYSDDFSESRASRPVSKSDEKSEDSATIKSDLILSEGKRVGEYQLFLAKFIHQLIRVNFASFLCFSRR